MKNIPLAILDEHPDWLNPLYQEFQKRGVPYQKIDISSAAYNPMDTNVLPFYVNRLSPSASKRGYQTAFNYTLNYLMYLESLGSRVVNGSHSVILETSKAHQSSLLRKLNIPQPRTIVLNDLALLDKYLDEFVFPVVVKPNCGGSGLGIQKFNTKKSCWKREMKARLSCPMKKSYYSKSLFSQKIIILSV